jgi:hypothetical protein
MSHVKYKLGFMSQNAAVFMVTEIKHTFLYLFHYFSSLDAQICLEPCRILGFHGVVIRMSLLGTMHYRFR